MKENEYEINEVWKQIKPNEMEFIDEITTQITEKEFKEETYNIPDYQGNAAINYTEEKIPYTRIIEHKHFNFGQQDHTIISKEYPQPWDKSKEKFYPMNDATNNALFNRYKSLIDKKKFIFGGRLANYKYYDMHQVIAQALTLAKKER